jgi:2-phosphoglycerate kinase
MSVCIAQSHRVVFPDNGILLLSGGTGVGTSTFAARLAREFRFTATVNTDCIREVLRTAITPSVNPALSRSTYLAGQTHRYADKSEAEKHHAIIREFKRQCSPIQAAVENIVRRAIRENRSVLIEGVHLHPGRLRETDWYAASDGRIMEICLYIDEPRIHQERFVYRQARAPERDMSIYLRNFREIRWIHDYLVERAQRFDEVTIINNDQGTAECMDTLLGVIGQRYSTLAAAGSCGAWSEAAAAR